MYILDLLKQRCVSELMEELSQEMEEMEEMEEMIKERLHKFDFLYTKRVIPMDDTMCAARVWGHKHSHQCRKSKKVGDYCTQHSTEIQDKGYLKFKRYDEPRPTINEHGEILPWYDGIETIDILFRYQRVNLHKLLKQRKITPE